MRSTERDRKRLNKPVKRASSILRCPLDIIEEVGERRVLAKMRSIMDNISQPLQETVGSLTSSFSKKERYQRSFFLTAVRLFNCYITTVCSTFYYYSIPALYYLFHIYFYCCCFFSYLFFCGSGAAVLSEFPRCWINKVYQIKWKTH